MLADKKSYHSITKKLVTFSFLLFANCRSVTSFAQSGILSDTGNTDLYYVGLNVMAPFSGIRGNGAVEYLPLASNLETGAAIAFGKFWNQRYNLETRASVGSYRSIYNLYQVQSSFALRFNLGRTEEIYFGGLFRILHSERKQVEADEQNAAIAGLLLGKRWIYKRMLFDLRLEEFIGAMHWPETSISRAAGFPPSIYPWRSPYIPHAGFRLAYLFK